MAERTKEAKVYRVFQNISQNYDGANERISLGMEKGWKDCLIDAVTAKAEENGRVLDVCCGTGDIALAIAKKRPDLTLTGLDFSPAMLAVARQKTPPDSRVTWRQGDAMNLPFEDNTFTAVCISFGLRNTADYLRVLREMTRVTRPNGWVYCLDSFVPDSVLIRPFYALYFRYLMPFLGGGWRYQKEYMWLWQSTRDFLKKKELLALFKKAGLTDLTMQSHLFGACVLHQGKKPAVG